MFDSNVRGLVFGVPSKRVYKCARSALRFRMSSLGIVQMIKIVERTGLTRIQSIPSQLQRATTSSGSVEVSR